MNQLILDKSKRLLDETNTVDWYGTGMPEYEVELYGHILASYYCIFEMGANYSKLLIKMREIYQASKGNLQTQCDAVKEFERRCKEYKGKGELI